MVLSSGPNGFSFLFPDELSCLARGKDMVKKGWEQGLEREVGPNPGGPRMLVPANPALGVERFHLGKDRVRGCHPPARGAAADEGGRGRWTEGAGDRREGRRGTRASGK